MNIKYLHPFFEAINIDLDKYWDKHNKHPEVFLNLLVQKNNIFINNLMLGNLNILSGENTKGYFDTEFRSDRYVAKCYISENDIYEWNGLGVTFSEFLDVALPENSHVVIDKLNYYLCVKNNYHPSLADIRQSLFYDDIDLGFGSNVCRYKEIIINHLESRSNSCKGLFSGVIADFIKIGKTGRIDDISSMFENTEIKTLHIDNAIFSNNLNAKYCFSQSHIKNLKFTDCEIPDIYDVYEDMFKDIRCDYIDMIHCGDYDNMNLLRLSHVNHIRNGMIGDYSLGEYNT